MEDQGAQGDELVRVEKEESEGFMSDKSGVVRNRCREKSPGDELLSGRDVTQEAKGRSRGASMWKHSARLDGRPIPCSGDKCKDWEEEMGLANWGHQSKSEMSEGKIGAFNLWRDNCIRDLTWKGRTTIYLSNVCLEGQGLNQRGEEFANLVRNLAPGWDGLDGATWFTLPDVLLSGSALMKFESEVRAFLFIEDWNGV